MSVIFDLRLSSQFFKSLVLPVGNSNFSNTIKALAKILSDKHMAKANCLCFLLIILEKFRYLVGPKVMPPPRHKGERIDPCRARPVPFCLQGFLPPPLTSLLSKVWAKT